MPARTSSAMAPTVSSIGTLRSIVLTPADLERLEPGIPQGSAAGERYPAPMMRSLNA